MVVIIMKLGNALTKLLVQLVNVGWYRQCVKSSK